MDRAEGIPAGNHLRVWPVQGTPGSGGHGDGTRQQGGRRQKGFSSVLAGKVEAVRGKKEVMDSSG